MWQTIYAWPWATIWAAISARDNPAKIDELTDLLAEAAFAWFSLEGSLVDNKHVTESWLFINDNHIRYVDGEISYHEIHTHCANIVTKPINKK